MGQRDYFWSITSLRVWSVYRYRQLARFALLPLLLFGLELDIQIIRMVKYRHVALVLN